MNTEWTRLDYMKALAGLQDDAPLVKDAPGRWLTFLRDAVAADITRLENDILALRSLHDPRQLERFNLLTGEIAGLRRFLEPDFRLVARLKAKIEELS